MSQISFTKITYDLCQNVADLVDLCFPTMPAIDKYSREDLEEMTDCFSEGTVIALDGETVVGMGTGIFVDIDFDNLPQLENELLVANGKSTHTLNGKYYFGSDICVHPNYRKRGIGRGLYDARKFVVKQNNKRGFAAAAVLPGYADHKDTMGIYQYLAKVSTSELFDPTLSMQLKNGFSVVRPLKDFFVYPESDNWAALIYWSNPNFQPTK